MTVQFKPTFLSSETDFETYPAEAGRLIFTENGEIALDVLGHGRVLYQEVIPAANEGALAALPVKRANQLFIALDTNTMYRWDTSASELVKIGGTDVDRVEDEEIETLLKTIGFLPED